MERIHLSKVWELMEKKDKNGKPVPFSLVYCKKSTGEIRNISACTITSFHSKGSTLNILLAGDIKPKTICKCLILEFNGKSVYL